MAIELSEKQIKDGWQIVKFGEIAKNIVERIPPKSGDEKKFIGLEHIVSGSLKVDSWGSETVLKAQAFKIKKGDIIYPKRNTYLRRVAVSPHDCIGSADFIVIRPQKVSFFIPDLLKFIMLSEAFHDFAIANSAGSLSKRTKWKLIAEFEFPLPPIERQKEILEVLEKVEECYRKSDLLYSSNVLCLNRLTDHMLFEGINTENKKDTILGFIPNNWKPVQLKEICEWITKGTTPTTAGFSFQDKGISFIKGESLSESGSFIYEQVAYVSEECHESFKRSQLSDGDVLLTIAGTIGRTAIVNQKILPANTNQAVAIIRPKQEHLCGQYLMHFLKTSFVKQHFSGIKTVGAQPNISLTQVRDLWIALPPIEEQKKIVDMLSKVMSIKHTVEQKLIRYKSVSNSLFIESLNGGVQ